MKKTILLLNGLLFSIISLSQQQIGNGDMETWTNVGTSNEEPANWNSFKTATGSLTLFAAQQIWRSTSIRAGATGSYCAQIKCVSILGVPANGNMTLGQINMNSSAAISPDNFNESVTADVNFSEALVNTPDSMVFWVKYTPVNASHLARVSTVLHDTYDYEDGHTVDAGSAPHKVGDATLNYGTTGGAWVRKSVPFVYTGPASANTYIIATFTTNMTPGIGNANDEVLIDDISLIYNPVNQVVTAVDDAISTLQDVAVVIPVLTNDVDPENDFDLTSVNVTSLPTNGTISVDPVTGEIIYTPNTGWFGVDNFTYSVCDNGAPVYCDNAVVTVTVNEVITGNNPIIANDDVAITDQDIAVVTNVVVNDVDFENQIDLTSLTVTVAPANGNTSVNNVTGEITYTPNAGYFGLDSYTYSICDAGTPAITCDQGVVSVTVNLAWAINEDSITNFKIFIAEQHIQIISSKALEGSYEIFTSNGVMIQEGSIENNILFNNPSGVYFIHLKTNEGTFIRKVFTL